MRVYQFRHLGAVAFTGGYRSRERAGNLKTPRGLVNDAPQTFEG